MAENNPVTGRPYGGRDKKPDERDEGNLPGERPLEPGEDEREAPESRHRDDETASRAPESGKMTSKDADKAEPTPGIPERAEAPSPADATEGDPPGGSAANQRGRTPDR